MLGGQPARTLRNSEEHNEKQERGSRGDAQLPAPFERAQSKTGDAVVGKIGQQDSDHHVDLKHSDQTATQAGGRQFGDIDRSEHRRAADAETSDETEDYERG